MTDERQRARPGLVLHGVPHPNDGPVAPKGPPLKYTRALHDAIVNAIAMGHRPGAAAMAAGIGEATFHEWVRKGREGDPYLQEFAEDVEMAEGEAEVKITQTVLDARFKDPKFALAWLERQRAKHWTPQVALIVQGEFEELFGRLERHLPPHVYEKVLAIASGATGVAATAEDEVEQDRESE